MSGLPLTADVDAHRAIRSSGPISDSCTAKAPFDNLVGELLELPWHLQVECLRGLEVDHKLELGRPLNGKLAWVMAFMALDR